MTLDEELEIEAKFEVKIAALQSERDKLSKERDQALKSWKLAANNLDEETVTRREELAIFQTLRSERDRLAIAVGVARAALIRLRSECLTGTAHHREIGDDLAELDKILGKGE